jgi:hypothetical protein
MDLATPLQEAHNRFSPGFKPFYPPMFEIFPIKNRDRSIKPKNS